VGNGYETSSCTNNALKRRSPRLVGFLVGDLVWGAIYGIYSIPEPRLELLFKQSAFEVVSVSTILGILIYFVASLLRRPTIGGYFGEFIPAFTTTFAFFDLLFQLLKGKLPLG